jgi:acetyl esterase/lipase
MDIKHFILVGDSAGGHLATSVSLLAAIRGFRIPDGIMMHYPVFTMDFERFFPSSLLTIDDVLLNVAFTKTFRSSFMLNGGNPKQSPILSPMIAPP